MSAIVLAKALNAIGQEAPVKFAAYASDRKPTESASAEPYVTIRLTDEEDYARTSERKQGMLWNSYYDCYISARSPLEMESIRRSILARQAERLTDYDTPELGVSNLLYEDSDFQDITNAVAKTRHEAILELSVYWNQDLA